MDKVIKGKWLGYYEKSEEYDEKKYGSPAPYFRKEVTVKKRGICGA